MNEILVFVGGGIMPRGEIIECSVSNPDFMLNMVISGYEFIKESGGKLYQKIILCEGGDSSNVDLKPLGLKPQQHLTSIILSESNFYYS